MTSPSFSTKREKKKKKKPSLENSHQISQKALQDIGKVEIHNNLLGKQYRVTEMNS